MQLERRGNLLVGLCPFHSEKTPSFTVFSDDHYHCFGYGAHGGAISYIRRTEGASYAEARARASVVDENVGRTSRRDRGTSRYAERLAQESVPMAGTLTERYLREARGLGDLPLPDARRFHPAVWCRETKSKHPALRHALALDVLVNNAGTAQRSSMLTAYRRSEPACS